MRGRRWGVLGALLVPLALTGCGGGAPDPPTAVEAVFEGPTPALRAGDPVRVLGLETRRVDAVRREDGRTIVSMRQEPRDPSGGWCMVAGRAYARIYPRIFERGRFYVGLEPPASGDDVLRDGDRIPPERTAVYPDRPVDPGYVEMPPGVAVLERRERCDSERRE